MEDCATLCPLAIPKEVAKERIHECIINSCVAAKENMLFDIVIETTNNVYRMQLVVPIKKMYKIKLPSKDWKTYEGIVVRVEKVENETLEGKKEEDKAEKQEAKKKEILDSTEIFEPYEDSATIETMKNELKMDTVEIPQIKKVKASKFPLSTMQKNLLHGFEDVLAFKVVNFVDLNQNIVKDVTALLWLQIPGNRASIYDISGDGKLCSPEDLSKNNKFCTSVARVIGIQFAGAAYAVKKSLLMFQCNRGRLASYHSPNFYYELQEDVEEPRAGEKCDGRGTCGYGIYFFTNPKSALRWRNLSTKIYPVVITKKLTNGRGLGIYSFNGLDKLSKEEIDEENISLKQKHKRKKEIEKWVIKLDKEKKICDSSVEIQETFLSTNELRPEESPQLCVENELYTKKEHFMNNKLQLFLEKLPSLLN